MARVEGYLPIVSALSVDSEGRIVVQTPIPQGGLTYYLDAQLRVLESRPSDNLAPLHERLRKQGLLDHPLSSVNWLP